MVINKFGGASIKDADSINRMIEICKTHINCGVLVVSAMGKTTNLLEKLVSNYFNDGSFVDEYKQFTEYHLKIIGELFPINHAVYKAFNNLINNLSDKLKKLPQSQYHFEYDQIVSFGELASTLIFSEYLNYIGHAVQLVDIRTCLKTNNTYRNAKVDWINSQALVKNRFNNLNTTLYLTQGFIGSDANNYTTTLGREGSDYTAAALANLLDAEKVVVWKDVPGIMCADPDWMPNTSRIDQLSYLDAIELAFYGAKVIHPKTIKPIQNKNIPLQVRSFLHQNNAGTLISNFEDLTIPPVYIRKENQLLISIKPTDYSFIIEENFSQIFGIMAKHQIAVNLMQNSAISFSVSVDNDTYRIKNAMAELKQHYDVKYNDNLELITIRHNQPDAENIVIKNKVILLEQRTRTVAQYLIRSV